MNDYTIVFSPHAKQQLAEVANYLYRQNLSRTFVVKYLNNFKNWLNTLLTQFPTSGMEMPDYGIGIRRVVYDKYSFLYRINNNVIEIVAVYRENLP